MKKEIKPSDFICRLCGRAIVIVSEDYKDHTAKLRQRALAVHADELGEPRPIKVSYASLHKARRRLEDSCAARVEQARIAELERSSRASLHYRINLSVKGA